MRAHPFFKTRCLTTMMIVLVPALCLGAEMTITVKSGALQEFQGWGIHPSYTKYKDAFRDTLNKLVVKDLNLNMVRFYLKGTDVDSMKRTFDALYTYPSGGNTIDDFKKQNPDMMFLVGQTAQILEEAEIKTCCDTWAAVVKWLRDVKGFDVRWSTIVNEPNDFGNTYYDQDSTKRILPDEWYAKAVTQMRASMDAQDLSMVKLYIPETSSVDDVCFALIDSVRNDPDALKAAAGLFVKSYNICANWKLKELSQEMDVPLFAAAGANMIDWWHHKEIIPEWELDEEKKMSAKNAAAHVVGAEFTPNDDNWAAEMAGRILNDFNHGVTHWLTYLPASEVDFNLRFAAHNLIQYFPNRDTITGLGYDPADCEVLGDNQAWIMFTLKYYYLKQLTQNIPVGSRFRSCVSYPERPYDDMAMQFGQKPAINACAARDADKTWTIALVNLTGCLSDTLPIDEEYHPEQYFKYYPAESCDVIVHVEELDNTGEQKFELVRSSKTKRIEVEDSVTMEDGIMKVTVGPKELVTLRGAKDAQVVGNAMRDGSAAPAPMSFVLRRDMLRVKIPKSGTYTFEVMGLDGRTMLKRDAISVSEPKTLTLGCSSLGGGVYLIRVAEGGAAAQTYRIVAR